MVSQQLFNGFLGTLTSLFVSRTDASDFTEALPLPDVEYIGRGDIVYYERLNPFGEVIICAVGKVINVNYTTQQVHLLVSSTVRIWVDVAHVSLVLSAVNATAAVSAEAQTAAV